MFPDERRARRTDADLPRATQPGLRPADRHARRLGVLGCVECRLESLTMAKAPAVHVRRAVSRTVRIAVPIVTATRSEVVVAGAALHFPMVAA